MAALSYRRATGLTSEGDGGYVWNKKQSERNMKLDLTKDQRKIRRYIKQRIKEYAVYENNGPGDDEDPIQLVTMGYYLEQTGYFALVFDTRPDADSDGEWTVYIDDDVTMLHFPKWCSMLEAWCEGTPIDLVLPTGKSRRVTRNSHTHETIAQLFGEMLRDTMIALRDEAGLAEGERYGSSSCYAESGDFPKGVGGSGQRVAEKSTGPPAMAGDSPRPSLGALGRATRKRTVGLVWLSIVASNGARAERACYGGASRRGVRGLGGMMAESRMSPFCAPVVQNSTVVVRFGVTLRCIGRDRFPDIANK